MVNEYAIGQAREHISQLKNELRNLEGSISSYFKTLSDREERARIIKEEIKDMERAKAILEAAQEDHA